ncbi:Signal recognition particle subunit SRP68 [Mycena indigotica]|uniref:Signal recognition particle subunit SRP68 n=1 Tax=Mycena indigotica TaxID=2126181 RepID=A0A8H6SX20_9AGAR|nr:Signal recognition particle subunit SRP68 [Mycena indigotica]KAF7306397.1 Signal recognition particle subunit SRP68 [Mycena indigotica]
MADKDKIVVFKALQLANEQRNAYGLRYNDYVRYRKHCANRTHRLRSTLKLTHGKGREFKKLPPLTPEIVKDGHLQLLLLEAERAWSYAQDLTAQSLNSADNAGTLRHSATGRFRRAVHHSTQLLSLCQALYASNRFSTESLLQVTIYTLILNGRFLRYRDEFDDALVQLGVARGLLDELAKGADTSRDQALATLFSDEIGPEIRHCAHELGRAKAYDVDGIVAEVAKDNRNTLVEGCDALIAKFKDQSGKETGKRRTLTPLVWEGQPVPVRNPELVDVLLRVQDAEQRLQKGSATGTSKKGVKAYDAILSALSDAEEVARKLVEAQQLNGSTSTVASGTRDIHFVHAYIVYQLLSRRIQRDLLLASALISSESAPTTGKDDVDSRLFPAVVKLLDTTLQSLTQMRTLSVVDDSPDLASAVDARIAYTKARRCLFLARSYTPVKKYAEALTLLQHANIHLRETQSTLSLVESNDPISDNDFFPLVPALINTLESTLNSLGLSIKREWFAFNGGAPDSTPRAEKKPLFFDIAVNYVKLDVGRLRERAGLPPLEEEAPTSVAAVPVAKTKAKEDNDVGVEEKKDKEDKQQPAAKGGLSSLLGGWWGRS